MIIKITKVNRHTDIIEKKRTKQSRSSRAQQVQRYTGWWYSKACDMIKEYAAKLA